MALRPIPILLVLTLSGLLVAGCSSTDGSSSASTAGGKIADAAQAASAAEPAAGAANSPDSAKPADGLAPSGTTNPTAVRKIRTAQITVEVKQLPIALAKVRATAAALGGQVTAEKSTFGTPDSPPNGPDYAESVLTVRVPEPRLDQALTQVAAAGKALDQSTTSDDVTAAIADLDSRVRNQTSSVARIRALMSQATSLKDVVLIEGQLTSRESDLEALQARQRVLNDQADLATMTVDLRTPSALAKTKPAKEGFLAGLSSGWHGITRTTTVALTVLGAILPFAIALALLTAIGYLAYTRGYRRLRPGAGAPEPAPGPGPGPAPGAAADPALPPAP